MHIPDGFLDVKTAVATGALSSAALATALRRLNRSLPRRKIPLMGLASAFVFAAQMVNFPVAAGTSGHLMGGVLTFVLLGPAPALVVLSAVLTVQCLLFADGGLMSLGANVFNMGVIGVLGGYAVYRLLWAIVPTPRGRFLAVTVAAWTSTVMASICCAGELAWSGTVPWNAAFPAMANVHMLIGVGEAVITTLVLSAIGAVQPDFLESAERLQAEQDARDIVVYGAVVIVGIILFISPFASRWPDGLEAVAAKLGFDRAMIDHPVLASPFGKYTVPGLDSPVAATVIAGVIGTVVMFVLGLILGGVATRARRGTEDRFGPSGGTGR